MTERSPELQAVLNKLQSELPAAREANKELADQATREQPRCRRCGKRPVELEGEYEAIVGHEAGSLNAEEVDEIMRIEEGTYNEATGGFWCTGCYIELGMPKGIAP
jgi:hypothetical protein